MEVTVEQKIEIMRMAVTYVIGMHNKALSWFKVYRTMLAEAKESNG